MLNFLKNDRQSDSLPQDVSEDMKKTIELEIKFWGVDKGIQKIYNYTSVDALKLHEMLETVPEIEKGI